jgi:hypothetical protein
MAQLIQTERDYSENDGEKTMLRFLKGLPDDYTVYRELRVTKDYKDSVRGLLEGRPDFVVVAPAIGLLSIEVKDWNLDRNTYSWRDQQEVVKRPVGSETEEKLDNPAFQAYTYLQAFRGLIKDTGVWVTSVVAFPRLSRSKFLNGVKNLNTLSNAQTRFLLDLETTIFREDIYENDFEPEKLLLRLVRKDRRNPSYSVAAINAIHHILMPPEFRIGEGRKRDAVAQEIKKINQKQEDWIFNLDSNAAYLLDVAGSGKTNALVSKAIHLVKRARKHRDNPPEILLTTYNPNLAQNIRQILSQKTRGDEDDYESIAVVDVESLALQIAAKGFAISVEDYLQLNPKTAAAFETTLLDDVGAAIRNDQERFRKYDCIFIDEIQDFDDRWLDVVRQLCRQRNFFFVGDIGQKIRDRYYNPERHNLDLETITLDKSYKMYRTPEYVGKLAYRFSFSSPLTQKEFEQYGYKQTTEFESPVKNGAEMVPAHDDAQAVVERIKDLVAGRYREREILVITSHTRMSLYTQAFRDGGLPFDTKETDNNVIRLVDFENVKGLEADVVMISGIEDLPAANTATNLFDDTDDQRKQEMFSRRKIYVALTRCLEECIVFYNQRDHRFVRELLSLNQRILRERQPSATL